MLAAEDDFARNLFVELRMAVEPCLVAQIDAAEYPNMPARVWCAMPSDAPAVASWSPRCIRQTAWRLAYSMTGQIPRISQFPLARRSLAGSCRFRVGRP